MKPVAEARAQIYDFLLSIVATLRSPSSPGSFAMTQYDSLGESYDIAESMAFKLLDVHNAHQVAKDYLKPGSKVIDFACGSGYYSTRLIKWGAASVTGVDISPAMLSVANRRHADLISSNQARFIVGDGTIPRSYAPDGNQGYFDMAFGGWFLNYATTSEDLAAMFATIAVNLKPGGIFIGMVPHPTNDLEERANAYSKPPLSKMSPRNVYTEPLDSGRGIGLHVFVTDDGVDFMTAHMRKNVYEEAARLGGMKGKLEWRREILLGDEWKSAYDFSDAEWSIREQYPHLGMLVVARD